ncbi:ATPase [Cladophialophora psammophila CBS 110553]|uniref:ATPase n=1 Tax=Cladophialophora psammophila CBS 110553 TaxID=1182543 RepID=W9WHL5_9EURO|nr:ATPase [Cladophialophora psammophila CBS 110553]EXJ67637.1 ATPase [Cladophialophora psammophila CBS 110553]
MPSISNNAISRFGLLWPGPFIQEPVDVLDIEPKGSPTAWSTLCLFALSALGLAAQLVVAMNAPWAILATGLWVAAALHIAAWRPRTASILLFFDFFAIFALGACMVAAQFHEHMGSKNAILTFCSAGLAAAAIIVVINMPLRDPALSRAEISRPFATPSHAFRSPEDNLTLLQWMTVSWLSPLIKIGNRRQLHDEDVWALAYEFQHRHLHDAFRELKGTVVRRLLKANWIDLLLLTALAILELAANYSAPMILQKLLQAMERIAVDKRPAIVYAILILVVRVVSAQSAVFSLWFGRRCYERSRGEMITMLYEKTLNRKILSSLPQQAESHAESAMEGSADASNLGETGPLPETEGLISGQLKRPKSFANLASGAIHKARSFFLPKNGAMTEKKPPASMGKILNLMRNDVYEVAQRFWEFQTLINKPLGLIVSIFLIWQMLGWSCFVGVAVVVVAQIFNYVLARILIGWEKERRKVTDIKLQKISQYVEAIRHLRWYGWHFTWLDGVMAARQKELNLRIITFLLNSAIKFLNSFASGMLPVATFYAYTIAAGHELRIDIAFPALQLFSLLQSNIRELPTLITVLLNASVAVGRISEFIAEPDKFDEADSREYTDDRLELQNASFSWPGLSRTVLRDLNLAFSPGLTVVFGPVAAGKTALLQALLGELDLRGGKLMKPEAPIGYCAQTPWLQSMSVRENILFNSQYDDARYKRTLEACGLLPDLANFKFGDLSNIGENGIGLSGGQKARVALARAVYSRAKILLLDDPLSALDQQTAEWIVARCFCGSLMEGRIIVLVTHRTDLCQHLASQLIEIFDGTALLHRNDEDLSKSLSATGPEVDPMEAEGSVEPIDKSAAVPDKFVEEEHRAHGGVQLQVYWEYIKAGTLRWWCIVILTAVICRVTYVSESWFLKEWGEAYNKAKLRFLTLEGFDFEIHLLQNPISGLFDKFPDPAVNVRPWLLGFLVIVACETVGLMLSQMSMLVVTYSAARRMFKVVMDRISNANFQFYDVTPVGRLMNRLTSDMGTIDGNIAELFLTVIWYAVAWISSMVVIASITPTFLAFAVCLTLAFVLIFLRFLPTSQSLRRLEMVSLTPLMSNFGALLNGLMTVRAFCAQSQFQERNIRVTDAFQKMDHFYWSLQGWLMYRFDTLSAVSTFLLTVLAIFSNLSAGLTAFLLISANKFVQSTHAICKSYGQLQLNFVSVERVVELVHIEQEPPSSIQPPAAWPTYGSEVVFEDVTIRYQPHLDPALTNVSLRFKGGSTNAITGRTGSGKSTLAMALLATITPESGRILVDGVDIAKIDKQALRSRITFLAQEPVLFPGSLRHNLDPMEEHSDFACESVLSRVCGKYGWTLQTQIDTGGRNLSQGQRQLVGLARAILRRSAIVIMDEATASIDLDTAAEIQRVLREELRESTIITIAHRVAAVENADFCVVLSAGRVVHQGQTNETGF